MCDSGLDLGSEKGHPSIIDKIWIKSIALITIMFIWFPNYVNVNLVALIIVILLCKMLIFGDPREDYMGILCTTFIMFC